MNTFLLRTIQLTTLVMVVLGASGCAQRLGRVPRAFRHDRESGIAVIGKGYTFSGNTTVHTDGPVHFTLKSNQPHTYEGRTAYPDFRAYLNPMTPAHTYVDVPVNFSLPSMGVPSGWSYLAGVSPMGQTTRVRAVGEGTRMIIEVDESVNPAVHRVYFIGDRGCRIHIYVPPDVANPVFTMTQVGTYLEVYEDLAWSDKGPYAADRTRAEFVAQALRETQGVN